MWDLFRGSSDASRNRHRPLPDAMEIQRGTGPLIQRAGFEPFERVTRKLSRGPGDRNLSVRTSAQQLKEGLHRASPHVVGDFRRVDDPPDHLPAMDADPRIEYELSVGAS